MADQLQGLVQKMQAEGVPESEILAFIDQFDAPETPTPAARPIATGGGRGTGLDVRKSNQWARDNAPVIGATLATTATSGGALPMILAATAGGAGGSALRGDDAGIILTEGATQGAYTAGGAALGRGITRAGQWVASKADPLIQRAVKPTISELRRASGKAGTSMAAEARRIAGIIKRTGIRTPEQAEAGIRASEERVQKALASIGPDADNVTVITDAPQRAGRYLDKLSRSASRQISPGDDLATVASERGQFERSSPLYQTVNTQVAKESPSSILDEFGRPVTRTTQETVSTRVPRANVTAGESLELARGTSRHATRKAYGEQRGMSVEAQKALDRAGRDAAKAAAPASMRADLQTQGDLIRLKPVLDRMMLRESNRDAMSLPLVVGAAPALAHGKVPLLGMAAQWLRNNQLRAGVGADVAGRAMVAHGGTAGRRSSDVARLLDLIMSQGSHQ